MCTHISLSLYQREWGGMRLLFSLPNSGGIIDVMTFFGCFIIATVGFLFKNTQYY